MKSRSSEVSRRLAVVADWPAPFRIHLNRRFAQAIAPMELVSPFYRAMPGTDCSNPDLQRIGTGCFGWYEERCSRGRIGRLIYDCRVAGRIWQKLKEDRVDAVIVCGQNRRG